MLNYLQNITGKTPISLLPEVINHNNEAVEAEFNWIYDSSTDRLIKSVYAPTGSVKAHFGEFVNLAAEYITVKNVESLKNTIKSAVSTLEHSTFAKSWSSDTIKDVYSNTTDIVLCHDASVIAYKTTNVFAAIQQLQTDVNALKTTSKAVQGGIQLTSAEGNTQVYGSNAMEDVSSEPTTYNKNMLYASTLQLKRKRIPKLHLQDLRDGNLYTYYKIVNNEVTITDETTACIDTDITGITVFVNFQDMESSQDHYSILLDRQEKKYVTISKNPLNILQLKAVSYSEDFGTVWKIYSYSVTNPGDIKLENK